MTTCSSGPVLFGLLLIISSVSLVELDDLTINKDECWQKRHFDSNYQKLYDKKCGPSNNNRKNNFIINMNNNFCDYVQCLTIKSCPEGWILVENVVGRGCCPECVHLLEEGQDCDPNSSLERCKNGLICDVMDKTCKIPQQYQQKQHGCLREYHNRYYVQTNHKNFYIKSDRPDLSIVFSLPYAHDQFMPTCTLQGTYGPKQRTQNKAYCVNSIDGKPTFGVIDSHRSVNQTCKCSESMNEKLALGLDRLDPNKNNVELDKVITEFNSDTHMKCKSSGNFQEIQCINETCLCVNEQTGKLLLDPKEFLNIEIAQQQAKILYEPEKPKFFRHSAAVVYGAINRLVCYEEEKDKTLKIPPEKIYQEDCYQEFIRSSYMKYHFAKKGTILEGLNSIKCGYDDQYYRIQCPDVACTCHSPSGQGLGSYRVESSQASLMDCRCALEEYLANTEKQSYDILRCDGQGNFMATQCYSNGQICECTDSNGARISERFSKDSMQQFLEQNAPGVNMETICQVMRKTLENHDLVRNDKEIFFDPKNKNFIYDDAPNPIDIFNK